MSLFGHSISRTGTHPDQYDHAINLVDNTKSQTLAPDFDVGAQATSSRASSPHATTQDGPSKGLSKRTTGTTLREELTKRKYRKYQEGRYSSDYEEDVDGAGSQVGDTSTPGEPVVPSETQDSDHLGASNIDESDFAHQQSHDARGRMKYLAKKFTSRFAGQKVAKHRKQADSEIDILYENQRGWFLFGIPLYSHKSLLNLDPAPWTTREFKDSAVNITNAQVPDPSWEWAWKSWYVDMSYDVDEEGWQYSLGFSSRSAWHGTHPWFHNFVRRRRWLRKRVKRSTRTMPKQGSMQQAHMLNSDYFTIHGTFRSSRDPSLDRRSSAKSHASDGADRDQVEADEIKDILALMKILRRASVDREKIDAVKKFIEQGGEEIYYLEEHIPQILSQFIFQNSRRQLLSYLLRTVKDARAHRNEHLESGDPEGETEQRRIDNLLKAVRAADEQIRALEFWSDVKKVEKGKKGEEEGEKLRLSKGTSTKEGEVGELEDLTPGLQVGKEMASPTTDIGEDIKGIPDEAKLDREGLKAIYDSGGPVRTEESKEKTDAEAKETKHDESTETKETEDDESKENKGDDDENTTKGKGKQRASDDQQEDVPAIDISVH